MLYELTGNAKEKKNLLAVSLAKLEDAKWSEKDLENLLIVRLNDIIREDQLMVIFQERKGQEEPDILALDKDGTLFIFELKRWQTEKDNLLQVIRYGQIFGRQTYEELENCFRKYSKDSDAYLSASHKEYFDLDEKLSPSDFNKLQRFIVVAAGIDRDTLDALTYWQEKGLLIDALVYHVYKVGVDRFFLHFPKYSPTGEDYLTVLSHDWVVNTNATYMPVAFQEMLEEKKASAFGDRKYAVDRIQKNDRVFLYHTGVGIIACGRARDKCRSNDYRADKEEEHYISLNLEYSANPKIEQSLCLPAYEINRKLGSSHRFRQTAFSISKEMGDEIERLLKARRNSKRDNL
jgi:hypothetical protein